MSIAPIQRREASDLAQPAPVAGPPTSAGWRRNAAFVVVTGLACLALTVAGLHLVSQATQRASPSRAVTLERGAGGVYLVQPTAVVTPQPTNAVGSSAPLPPDVQPATTPARTVVVLPGSGGALTDESVHLLPTAMEPPSTAPAPAQAGSDVPLPPVGLEIPAIHVSVPVMLATSDSLPHVPYAGWLLRSAFPATAGNVVLLGHLDGDAAIFAQLDELVTGDEIHVLTDTQVHVYLVEWVTTVDAAEVEVLAPTDNAVVTLITCAGDWDRAHHAYTRRLVVRARYAAVDERANGFSAP
jgi:LPXTG-site transpeptidase (sortase) family protein